MARLGSRAGLQLNGAHKLVQNNSDVSGNDSTLYVGRASANARSGTFNLFTILCHNV